MLVGAKGVGKGTYLAGLASRVSRIGRGRNVIFVSTEDSAEIDLKPRLVAAKAKIERCFLVNQHVHLPGDVEALKDLAKRTGNVGLLVIDPVANHIPDVRSSNSDAEIRDAISPLNKLADDLSCLLIGVRHPGKDRSRGALLSVLGSTAWVDVPRAVVAIAADDEDKQLRHIQVVAGNRSLNGAGQMFRIEAVDVPGLMEPITLAVALGESPKDVDDLLAAASRQEPETKTGRARELILDILEKGEQESDALDARVAKETGLAARTVRNARMGLIEEGLVKPGRRRTRPAPWSAGRSTERWLRGRDRRDEEPSRVPWKGLWENPRVPNSPKTGLWSIQAIFEGTLGSPESLLPETRDSGGDSGVRAVTERAIFNLRLRIEGDDRAEVWWKLNQAMANFREDCPDGVEVAWASLRPARFSRDWEATMEPRPRKRKGKR